MLKQKLLFFMLVIAVCVEQGKCLEESFVVHYKQRGNICKNSISLLTFDVVIKDKQNKQRSTIAQAESAESVVLKTHDGNSFPALYFNRGNDTILVLGQGFPGVKEGMLFEAGLFAEYDVIVFDYRWNELGKFLLNPLHWDSHSLLIKEADEVESVLDFLQQKKQYKNIVGLSQCYSCFTFVMAQYKRIKHKKLGFTKLILDSCWLSLFEFAKQLCMDPLISIYPQEGGAPEFLKNILKLPGIHYTIYALLYFLVPNVSIEKYLAKISCPLLFIHGTKDLLVPYPESFLTFFNLVFHDNVLGFITPSRHVNSSVDFEHVYKHVCDLFINNDCNKARTELLAMQQ